ncbi:MAG TPA: Maf family protein [Gammaproteobacteria bacterium]|jgi:septum formation protein|nr:Maf family protein [Gammaproteobacteria bacterium]
MTQQIQLYLASASPRRRELLSQIGLSFAVLSTDVAENIIPGETPEKHALRLAIAKAEAGWESPERTENKPVLGADTIVVLGDLILGKPKNKADSVRMLGMLSGKKHEVITAVAVKQGDKIVSTCVISHVWFREISQQEAQVYWETNEPADKAGSYAIQGKAAVFIEKMEGSYSGIMGLPLFESVALLNEFDVRLF